MKINGLLGEHIVVKLGAVVVGHGSHVVDNYLIGLGLKIRESGVVMVLGNKVDMVSEYR